ncbi:hypothetical protein JHW43_001995 [Diplocarpon mali]|nr:hypothetical protein JHW43_001995 [Diplocarpon mali]
MEDSPSFLSTDLTINVDSLEPGLQILTKSSPNPQSCAVAEEQVAPWVPGSTYLAPGSNSCLSESAAAATALVTLAPLPARALVLILWNKNSLRPQPSLVGFPPDTKIQNVRFLQTIERLFEVCPPYPQSTRKDLSTTPTKYYTLQTSSLALTLSPTLRQIKSDSSPSAQSYRTVSLRLVAIPHFLNRIQLCP